MKAQGAITPLPESRSNRVFTFWIPLLLALFVILAWGVSFSVTRVAVGEIPPFTLAFLRFALAYLLLLPLTLRRFGDVAPSREDRKGIFLLGFVGVSIYFAFENLGLRFTTASHAALIIATIPLCTELTRACLERRFPSIRMMAGLLTALAGVALIMGRNGGGGATLLGDLLMLGAVAAWVWYTFLADRLVRRYPNLLLTRKIMGVGAATLLPASLGEAYLFPFPPPSAEAWAGVAFLGLVCSALAYHLWNQAIPVLGVTLTNNLLYGIPLVGVLTGIIALGEPLTFSIAAGSALILGGVLFACLRSSP